MLCSIYLLQSNIHIICCLMHHLIDILKNLKEYIITNVDRIMLANYFYHDIGIKSFEN